MHYCQVIVTVKKTNLFLIRFAPILPTAALRLPIFPFSQPDSNRWRVMIDVVMAQWKLCVSLVDFFRLVSQLRSFLILRLTVTTAASVVSLLPCLHFCEALLSLPFSTCPPDAFGLWRPHPPDHLSLCQYTVYSSSHIVNVALCFLFSSLF